MSRQDRKSHRQPPPLHTTASSSLEGSKAGGGVGASVSAGQRGVPTRARDPRLGERMCPAVQGQPVESLSSQLGRGLPVATGAGSEELQGLLKSQHILNTATHTIHSATARAHNQTLTTQHSKKHTSIVIHVVSLSSPHVCACTRTHTHMSSTTEASPGLLTCVFKRNHSPGPNFSKGQPPLLCPPLHDSLSEDGVSGSEPHSKETGQVRKQRSSAWLCGSLTRRPCTSRDVSGPQLSSSVQRVTGKHKHKVGTSSWDCHEV